MTNRKYRSFGKHLPGLLLILALVPLLSTNAAGRSSRARIALAHSGLERGGSELERGTVRDLTLAERPRRVTASETSLSAQPSYTSQVIYRSMSKFQPDGAVAAPTGGTNRAPVKQTASLDSWPGLNFRETWAAGRGTTSPAHLADRTPIRYPVRVSYLIESTTEPGAPGSPAGAPGQKRSGTVSTAPMTAGEKFTYFLRKSFMPPTPYALSVLGGVFGEALDTKDKKHRNDAGEFLADSMTRAARSFAFRSTANFFEKFAYATMFKQDPRYHRSNNIGFGAKVGYAISRIFITQGDRGGRQFNASFIVGGLSAAGMSNLWVRDEHMNVGDTFVRWGEHVGLTALSNIVREFIGGQ